MTARTPFPITHQFLEWSLRVIAAFALSGPLTLAQAAEITVPVPFAEGQTYQWKLSYNTKGTARGAQTDVTITAGGKWQVYRADTEGFVIEERTLFIDTPQADGNIPLRRKVTALVAKTTSNVMTRATTRMRTNKDGAPESVLNSEEIRRDITAYKDTLLDDMATEMTGWGMGKPQIEQVRGLLEQTIKQTYLSSDETLASYAMETFGRFSLPMGMTLDTEVPLVYGNASAGEFAHDGTAGTIRITSHDPAAKRIAVQWEQHYAPERMLVQKRAIAAVMTQSIKDKAQLNAALEKLTLHRVDNVSYDIDLMTGLPLEVTIREALLRNGEEVRVSTKSLTIRRR